MNKNKSSAQRLPKRYTLTAKRSKRGFTLIELLIVIGIISTLAAIIFVAVDPAKRLSQVRNTKRWSEATSIVSAVIMYSVDHADYPGDVDTNLRQLGTDTTGCDDPICVDPEDPMQSACLNIGTGYLVDEYLSSIPFDPKTGSEGKTRYAIKRTSGGRISVTACDAELEQGITASR